MPSDVEVPRHITPGDPTWGSDLIAQALRELGIDLISLNPGASYRGLHDSLVNFLGNDRPKMVLCLHEEHAVAIAHGYAKVTDRPMAVAVHTNVGLMHASMALFNAFCDRVPMLVLGGVAPVDERQRRAWIDWLHATADQGALVRMFTKWDQQPASAEAAVVALARAWVLTCTKPSAPSYVGLDWNVQEDALPDGVTVPGLTAVGVPAPAYPNPRDVAKVVDLLHSAERPLVLAGRTTRSETAWQSRVAFAEQFGATVLTHLQLAAAFPSEHPQHPLGPVSHRTPQALEIVRSSDVIVSLDWLDLAGMLKNAGIYGNDRHTVINVSVDQHVHNGWSKDHFDYALADLNVVVEPDMLVEAAVQHARQRGLAPRPARTPARGAESASTTRQDAISLAQLAEVLSRALRGRERTIVRIPSGWPTGTLEISHPLDFLGGDGGAGIGSGPGMVIGAALALRDSGRLAVGVIGDGDFCMGMNALWTAAHYSVPMLIVVANNGSYLNDEIHQHRAAEERGRPIENRWIGQHMTDPAVDIAAVAEAQGLVGIGPVTRPADLLDALKAAIAAVDEGKPVVVDVKVAIDIDRAPVDPLVTRRRRAENTSD